MTNPNKTLIAALLDRSGSMHASREATEEGFNALIVDQAKVEGQAFVTLAQFDSHSLTHAWPHTWNGFNVYGGDPIEFNDEGFKPEYVYEFKDITSVPKLTISPRGGTPLLDALGNFITKIGADLSKMREQDRPGTVVVVVLTDGQENQSRAWNRTRVKELIRKQEDVYNWRFIFLGSNIDAVREGSSFGVSNRSAMTYDDKDAVAVAAAFTSTSNLIGAVRGGNLNASYSSRDRSAAVGK